MIYGAVTALVLLIAAFWIGVDYIGAKEYQKGFAAGQTDERSKDEEKMKTLTARLAAEGLKKQLEESAIAREKNRIQDAAREAARVAEAEELAGARTELARVVARVRAVEAAARDTVRRANRDDRVPQAAGAPAGADGPACPGALPEGRREAALGLNAEADAVSAKYRACLRIAFPTPEPAKP